MLRKICGIFTFVMLAISLVVVNPKLEAKQFSSAEVSTVAKSK